MNLKKLHFRPSWEKQPLHESNDHFHGFIKIVSIVFVHLHIHSGLFHKAESKKI